MSVIQQWYRIGGQGGTGFTQERISQRQVVTKIEAWAGGWQLRGIQLTFSDGTVVVNGRKEERYQGALTMDYASGEYVNYLSIYGNGAGTRCGALHIKTSKGQDYFPQMYDWGLKTEYKMEVGSGIILGAFGKAWGDIDSLGILMLRKVIGADMTNVVYDMRGENLLPPQKKIALDVTLANPSDTDSDKGFQKVTKSHQTGGSWSITAGVTFGQTYKVSSGVPDVVDVGVETKWEVSVSSTYGKSWSTTEGYETSIPLIAPKLEKTRITVDYYEGSLSKLPYTAQMKYFLDNGSKFYTHVNGVYDGVATSRFVQETTTVATWDDTGKKWIPVPGDSPQFKRTTMKM
ncbi:natterin-like protein [Gracilaria domingensis]|nr:natterin-like protein [Gracilaria domingensis]